MPLIVERYGIPDAVKRLTKSVVTDVFRNGVRSFVYPVRGQDLKEIVSIGIEIVHERMSYDARFSANPVGPLNTIRVRLDIPVVPDPGNLAEVLTHEFTHLYEFYQIQTNNRKFPLYDRVKKGLIRTSFQESFDIFLYFRNLIYLTLDNEMNARVAETAEYLRKFRTTDRDVLTTALRTSPAWKKVGEIDRFDPRSFTKDLISEVGVDLAGILISGFNKELRRNGVPYTQVSQDVRTEEEILIYFREWSRRFRRKLRIHIKKLQRCIYDVLLPESGPRDFGS